MLLSFILVVIIQGHFHSQVQYIVKNWQNLSFWAIYSLNMHVWPPGVIKYRNALYCSGYSSEKILPNVNLIVLSLLCYGHSGNNLWNNWLNTVFPGHFLHVWPPGVTTNIIKGYFKALHLVSSVYKFIPNASFRAFGIFQKPKIAKNWYFFNIFNKI